MNKQIINNINDFIFYKDKIKKINQWFIDFKNNKTNKRILLIIGNVGTGKTYIANIFFKLFQYKVYEINSIDIRSKKRIEELFNKSLKYNSVIDMFNNRQCSLAIFLDELETIIKNGDKTGLNELLSLLKKNILIKNPVVCTCHDITDKKLTEFKKYCEVIYLRNPSNYELEKFIDNLCKINNINIMIDAKIMLVKYCYYDINKLIQLFEDIYYKIKPNKIIELDIVEKVNKYNQNKLVDYQINDIINKILYTKLDINIATHYFISDCLLIPLLIHQNSLKRIDNTKMNDIDKWNTLYNVVNSLSINDKIQTSIFETNEWNNLYDICAIYGSVYPNYYLSKLEKKNKSIDNFIEYSNLLNKSSQMYINKKLIIDIISRFTKQYVDYDQLYFISYYISKLLYNNNDESLKELVIYMKKNNLNINDIEVILKFEKFNNTIINKFTSNIKKNLDKFYNDI